MNYLVGVTIGPVQSFIAAARKVRDLYAGSWMLSEIAKAIALAMGAEGLVFPAATETELRDPEFACVNKIYGIVLHDRPSELAVALRRAALARLENMVDTARANLSAGMQIDWKLSTRQLEGFLEFGCAWVPLPDEDRYAEKRAELERILTARKALNAFPSYRGEPGRRKCTIDGHRESVIVARGKTDEITLREKEELDAPALVKRFLRPRVRFDSTFEAAGLPFLRRLQRHAMEDAGVAAALGELIALNSLARLNEESSQLLYEHESRDAFAEGSDEKQRLRSLRQEFKQLRIEPDAPYYALMIADGDSMGEFIANRTIGEHRQLSRNLAAFATGVSQYLRDRDCMPVFAGGDDVVAVIPLHRLRAVLWGVRELFARVGGAKPTLSAGVAIMHAVDPLDEAREVARQAEQFAKRQDGKNSLVITVRPRSGADVRVAGKWWDEEDHPALGARLPQVVRALREDRLSFGFAHELRHLLATTPEHDALEPVLPQLALAIATKKEKKDSIAPDLVRATKDRADLGHLMACMLVARKIAKAETEAGEPLL